MASAPGPVGGYLDYNPSYLDYNQDYLDYDPDVVYSKAWAPLLTVLHAIKPAAESFLKPAADRQDLLAADNPVVVAVLVAAVLVLLQALPVILGSVSTVAASAGTGQLLTRQGGGLQNNDQCGVTTGGQDECWWDCQIESNRVCSGQYVPDLACLLDCFPDETSDGYCITSLLQDVIARGTCNVPTPNVECWGTPTATCAITEPDFVTTFFEDITEGTCSDATEALLSTDQCVRAVKEQNGLIKNTLTQIVANSCKTSVACLFDPFFPCSVRKSHKRRKQNKRKKNRKHSKPRRPFERLAPVQVVAADYKTELDYTHTRHRYPWVCSLRSKGVDPEHLCAVTLLSVPPQSTVIVGAAHCTYQCGDDSGNRLPACCCVTIGQESCTDDSTRCGTTNFFNRIGGMRMDGSHAEIVCGEWDTSSATQQASGEQYNVVLPITEIIRHPNYNERTEGVGAGSDIAVFKVDDSNLSSSGQTINPACLPPKGQTPPAVGFHTGWSKPPPPAYVEKYAPLFTKYYGDFFKQWHYRMQVSATCEDPKKSQYFDYTFMYPAKSYYPPGLICATEAAFQSCFSTGDSGAPLMAEDNDGKFYAEGILSFVKGCDIFQFTAGFFQEEAYLNQLSQNPAAYTKLSCFLPWVAAQYGLTYDGDDPTTDASCTIGNGAQARQTDTVCRETISATSLGDPVSFESECIFPFYYNGKRYDQCLLFEELDFVYPVFRCPTRNITTKYLNTGISSFSVDALSSTGMCVTDDGELDPTVDTIECGFTALPPFSTCKNDCPGVRGFGVIAGGAALLALSGLSGAQLLPVIGLGGVATVGGGGGVARAACMAPFCTAASGQCCLLINSNRGPRCPRSC